MSLTYLNGGFGGGDEREKLRHKKKLQQHQGKRERKR